MGYLDSGSIKRTNALPTTTASTGGPIRHMLGFGDSKTDGKRKSVTRRTAGQRRHRRERIRARP